MSRSKFQVALLVLILIVFVANGSAQMLIDCTNQPLIPRVYFDVMGEDKRACTPVGLSQQDALVCMRSESPTVSYTRLRGTNLTDLFCVIRNTSLCDTNGGYDGISVKTSREDLNSAGKITIASGNIPMDRRITINIEFGPIRDAISSQPLEIQNLQLNSGGSVVISDKVFFGQVTSIRRSYTVCEIMSNGSVVIAPFAAQIGVNPLCKEAASGPALRLSVARTITLHDQSTQVKNYTLFLTGSSECSNSAPRISNNFTVTVVAVTTYAYTSTFLPTTAQTTQLTTVATNLPGSDTGTETIVGVVVGVVVAVVCAVLLLLSIIALWHNRKKKQQNNDMANHGSDTYPSIASNGFPSRIVEAPPPLSIPGTDDNDSGVILGWSPGPSTPHSPEIVVIMENPGDPWYQSVKTTLGESFKSSVKELRLPESAEMLSGFESDLYTKLASEQCRHLFIFTEFTNSKSAYSDSLLKLIKSLESRPCPYFIKLWVIIFGAPAQEVIPSNINRLCVTQMPGKDTSTSKKCALSIHEVLTTRQRSHSCTVNGQGPASTNLYSTQVNQTNGSATDPLRKRDDFMGERLVDTSLANAVVTGSVDLWTELNRQAIILNKIDSNVQQIKEGVQHVEGIAENEAIQRDKESILKENETAMDT